MKRRSSYLIPSPKIENKILWIRGMKVMLDRDLSELYQVKAIALRQQVKRNQERFPADFMFQLTTEETEAMVSQNVIPSPKYFGGYFPYAFTEQGIAMLSSVLKSRRAVHVNIQIMRTFTKIRKMLLSNEELRKKIEEMERKYDDQFKIVFEAIKRLLDSSEKPKEKMGFHIRES